ncbi:RICIN domain-containing protein [Streptomyces sp. NPDC059092]|uniref:RICIN domain-containing protein n=1 Tax=Streptomyces sp. NPDC059092 TaxID=3346725 RepID=UPI0036847B05
MTEKRTTAVALGAAAMVLGGLMVPASQAAVAAAPAAQTYSFYSERLGQMLDSSSFGTNAITWAPNGSGYQQWTETPGSTGIQLMDVRKGKCLQAPASTGQPVAVATCNRFTPTQQWKLVVEGDDTLIARASNSGEVIGAVGADSQVRLETKTNSRSQRWLVSPA